MPYVLHERLMLARTVISWHETLDKDEVPPKRLWLEGEKLKEWFAEVDRKREDKFKDGGSKDIEDPVRNPGAEDLIVGG